MNHSLKWYQKKLLCASASIYGVLSVSDSACYNEVLITDCTYYNPVKKNCDLSLQVNYTDQATAACR
jgi:hypothetical protein